MVTMPADWMTLRIARKNGGVFEPEQRLWGFAIPVLVQFASLILWGIGASHHVHWFGLTVAMCGNAFCVACSVTLSVTYLLDCFPDIGGAGIVSVLLVRNTMSL